MIFKELTKILDDTACLPFVVFIKSPTKFNSSLREMVQSNSSSRHYGVSGETSFSSERLPVGPALLAVFGLSLLGWACALVPLVAALHP